MPIEPSFDYIIGLGIDQGIAHCGYGIVQLNLRNDEITVVDFGTLETTSHQGMEQRISFLYEKIASLIDKYHPFIIGCERLFFNTWVLKNQKVRKKSASIVQTNMATGILYLLGGQRKIFVEEFAPTTVKKYITGNGKAKKEEVKTKILEIAKMKKEIKTSHESDAIGISITSVKYYQDYYLPKMLSIK